MSSQLAPGSGLEGISPRATVSSHRTPRCSQTVRWAIVSLPVWGSFPMGSQRRNSPILTNDPLEEFSSGRKPVQPCCFVSARHPLWPRSRTGQWGYQQIAEQYADGTGQEDRAHPEVDRPANPASPLNNQEVEAVVHDRCSKSEDAELQRARGLGLEPPDQHISDDPCGKRGSNERVLVVQKANRHTTEGEDHRHGAERQQPAPQQQQHQAHQERSLEQNADNSQALTEERVDRSMLLHCIEQLAILRPAQTSAAILCPWVITHVHLVAAISMHLIHFGATIASRDEGDLAAVGRPCWSPVGFAAGKRLLMAAIRVHDVDLVIARASRDEGDLRSEEHTSELQSQFHLVCRLLL